MFSAHKLAAGPHGQYARRIAPEATPEPSPAPSKQDARFALIVTLLGIFGSNITLTILTIALPHVAVDLDAPRALTNWVTLGPMLVVAVLTPASGRLADSYGRKKVWLTGSVLALLGMLASALAPGILTLILARVGTGVGTALMVPAGLAIATGLYPPEQRATPLGYWTSTVAISPMLGVLLGGLLLEYMSWRWLFAGQILLGMPPLIAAAVGFKEHRFPVGGRFDWEGAIAIGSTSLSLMLAATWLGAHGLFSARVLGSLTLAAGCALWTRSASSRAESPVLPPQLISEPAVALSLLARGCMNFAYMGAFMVLPYLLSELWQLTASAVSLRLVFRPLAMGLTGPFSGRLAARFGPARLVFYGTAAILVSTAAFLLLGAREDAGLGNLLLVPGLVVAGIGLGLSSPGTVAIVTARVDVSRLGTASGLMTVTSTLANALGMAIMFAVVESTGGVSSLAAFRRGFLVGTLVLAVGLLAGFQLMRLERRQLSPPGSDAN